ncbi:MAG: isoprenyl transferase [Verrucomicrobiota bacterium]
MQTETTALEGVPAHVAIIMDGNGRWAQQRNLPRIEGHRRGVDNARAILEAGRELGICVMTLFAFSVENWKRPKAEVDMLMRLLQRFLTEQRDYLHDSGARLRVIGQMAELPASVRRELERAIDATRDHTERTVVLALNYGARSEMVAAMQAIAKGVAAGEITPEQLDWPTLARHLYTADLPDPDLVIRTSGESRLSNFLLLQSAYSELFFSPVYWPDFSAEHLREAIDTYRARERRFGQTGEQVRETKAQSLVSTL